jgi:phosphohistidine phosphatase
MLVLIVRHAAAVDPRFAPNDEGRWLTDAGRRTMRRMTATLREAGITLDRILTSPLVRAVQTAEILASGYEFDGPLEAIGALAAERGTTAQALAPLVALAADAHVALVSHEPKVSRLAAHLLGERDVPGFHTATAWLLEVTPGEGPGRSIRRFDPE